MKKKRKRMNIISRLIKTNEDDWSLLILRFSLGAIIFPHGAQKLMGWFGGPGFLGTMEFLQNAVGINPLVAFLVIMAESIAAIFLIFGFMSRFMAASIGLVMGGAMFFGGHLQHGFFINWFGNQAGEGIEYHLLMISISIVIVLYGGGKNSVDSFIQKGIAERRNLAF